MTHITSITRRYAHALIEIAKETKQEDRIEIELNSLKALFETEKKLFKVIIDPLFPISKKMEIIEKLAHKLDLTNIMKNFLKLLIDKRKFTLIFSASDAYKKFLDDHRGRVRVKFISAVPISEELNSKVKRAFEKRLGKQVILEKSVDPEILGGAITQIGFIIFDGSLTNHLLTLKSKLLTSR